MLSEHGFTLTAACKEAKMSRVTAKKWLGKRQHNSDEVFVEHLKPEIPPEKAECLVSIKHFIDEHNGNCYLKEIRSHLQKTLNADIKLATLGNWVKKNLNYTYKKCSTVSPDIHKVVLVEHQVSVSI